MSDESRPDIYVRRTDYKCIDGAGDGEWSQLDCGCQWVFGNVQGVLFFRLCDAHPYPNLPLESVVEDSGSELKVYDEFRPDGLTYNPNPEDPE